MNVTAFLRKTKNKTKATVYFRVRDNDCNCDLKAASELSIHPQQWDSKRMGYKTRVTIISDAERFAFNSAVQELIREISRTYFKGATSEWLKKTIFCFHHPQAYKLEGTKCVEVKLSVIIDQYIESKDFDRRQQIVVHSLVGKIERFEQYQRQIKRKKNYTMSVDAITAADLTDLYNYLVHEHEYFYLYPDMYKGVNKSAGTKPRGDNTLHAVFSRLRTVIKWAVRQGITKNNPFDRYELPKSVYGTPFFLTLEERNKMIELDLSDEPHLSVFRDMFIFQSMIGCRFGDLLRLTSDSVIDGVLEYIPHKTMKHDARTVRIPLTPKAMEIYQVYKERNTLTLFPHYNVSDYNKGIRAVMRKAGLNRTVSVINSLTHKTEAHPLCEIATSHTARKTFVGNLYKVVQDPNLISSMSGHANGSRAFARYRTIDDDMKKAMIQQLQ